MKRTEYTKNDLSRHFRIESEPALISGVLMSFDNGAQIAELFVEGRPILVPYEHLSPITLTDLADMPVVKRGPRK